MPLLLFVMGEHMQVSNDLKFLFFEFFAANKYKGEKMP